MSRRARIGLTGSVLAAGAGAVAIGVTTAADPEVVTARTRPSAGASASSAVLTRAKLQSPSAYRLAQRAGARIARTPDGRSFYVRSPGARRGAPTVVTYHGYLSTAFDGYAQFREAPRRGYNLLAIHWRLGKSSKESYTPAQMYGQARRLVRGLGVPAGDALLHGYSSAAARIYGAAALDRRSSKLFGLYIGDAGGARPKLPMYQEVFGGGLGPTPLGGSRWILFCGGRDPDPQLTGCPVMRRTRSLIVRRGGSIERFIVDPRSSHGGFHENLANQRVALDVFARLLD